MGIKLQSLNARPNRLVDSMTDGAMVESVITEVRDGVESEINLFSLQSLTTVEQTKVNDLISRINLHDSGSILNYGRNTQRKLGHFADATLQSVLGCNVGVVGESLEQIADLIDDFDKEVDSRSLLAIHKARRKIRQLQAKYDVASRNLEKIRKELMNQEITLQVDIDLLSKMYEESLEYCRELNLYILAGRKKLEETRNSELGMLKQKLEQNVNTSNMLGSEYFQYDSLVDYCDSFEQQIANLELARTICLSMIPQIRMIQRADERLVQKIQSGIYNTIPIWKQNIATSIMTNCTTVDLQLILNSNNEFYAAIADVNAENQAGSKLKTEAAKHLSACVEKAQQTS